MTLVVATITNAQKAPLPKFDFRGESFGDSLVVAEEKGIYCGGKPELETEQQCFELSQTIAGVETSIVRDYLDGRLYSVTVLFSSDDYEQLLEAITAKYGPSASNRKAVIQNRVGAAFLNERRTWRFGGGEMTMSKYGSTVTRGMLVALHTARARERD